MVATLSQQDQAFVVTAVIVVAAVGALLAFIDWYRKR